METNFSSEILGNNLRAERTRLKLTREVVAEKTGICTKTLENYENGTRDISFRMLLQLSHLYQCDIKDFLVQRDILKQNI